MQMRDEFGNITEGFMCDRPGCDEWHPVPVPWEICQCGYLPGEDRDYCTKHGTDAKAKPQSESEPETQPQPRRVVDVGRTRPLYDVSSGCSTLDKIEDIANRADMDGELTRRQLGALRWALRKCRTIMIELGEDFESL